MQLQMTIKAKTYLTGELAMRGLANGKVKYAIIAKDTSLSHRQSIQERLTYYRIPFIVRLSKLQMTQMTKKDQVVMIAVTEPNLARLLKEKESYYEET
jgi:ribosomal protein L30E